LCYHHDPARAEERSRNASRAASAKHSSVAQELRDVRDLIWELLGLTIADRLPHRARKELQNVVQLLQCYLRAVELEMRAFEEPLRSDLDVALPEGTLERIREWAEGQETKEREKKELEEEISRATPPSVNGRSILQANSPDITAHDARGGFVPREPASSACMVQASPTRKSLRKPCRS
jgi:hypothetical protein